MEIFVKPQQFGPESPVTNFYKYLKQI